MNSNLQNKLSRFEASPPGEVWDKIANVLDEENFSKRLYHYEAVPKTNLWNKINATLAQGSPAIVVPFTTRYRKPIRFIAAAGILAVILISATLLMKQTEAGSVETAGNEIVTTKKNIIQEPAITFPANSNNQRDVVTNVANNYHPEVNDAGTKQKRFLSFIRPRNFFRAIIVTGSFAPADVEEKELFSFSKLNDYMVYSDGDGNAMKMPKKLFSLVNCPDGDGSCRERIDKMQQKLSSTAVSADFTGILEMLRQLQ